MTTFQDKASSWLDTAGKTSGLFVSATVLCFVAGFAITNTYLGSLGVATFDILRVRYVLSGLLFSLFIGVIAFLLAGVVKILRQRNENERLKTINRIIWYSVFNLTVVSMVISAISVFGGLRGTRIDNPPGTIRALDWTVWWSQEPYRILYSVLTLAGLLVAAVLTIGILVILANPQKKDSPHVSRRQGFREWFQFLRKSGWTGLQSLAGALAFLLFLQLLASAMSFWMTGAIQTRSMLASSLEAGWNEYFFAIALVYSIATAYLCFVSLFSVSYDLGSALPFISFTSYAYLVAAAILIGIPIYALKIYPYLPQQVGGGQPIPVQIIANSGSGSTASLFNSMSTYLIDRTDSSYIFLVRNPVGATDEYIEIRSGLIDGIQYVSQP